MFGAWKRRGKRQRLGRRIKAVVLAMLAATAAATVAGYFGALTWWLDGFSHFRVQYALAALPLGLALLLFGRRRAAAAALAVFLVNGWEVSPQVLRGGTALAGEVAAGEPLRIVAINLLASNHRHERVREFLEREQADMVVLIELTPAWMQALDGLQSRYPHRLQLPHDGGFGIGLLSREPWQRAAVIDPGGTGIPSIEAEYRAPEGRFTLIGTHPRQPGSDGRWRQRNRQFDGLARHIAALSGPVAVLGDFNSTPWSVHMQRFVATSGLVNAAEGHGWQPTWPTWFPPAGVAIDHAFVSPEVAVLDWRTGPHVGSDHRPIVVDIAF